VSIERQELATWQAIGTKTDIYVQIFLDSYLTLVRRGGMADQKPLRVALYSRVSTEDKGQDVRNQTDQLREFCSRQNWQIVQEYTDRARRRHASPISDIFACSKFRRALRGAKG
jgi:hypothetical protein